QGSGPCPGARVCEMCLEMGHDWHTRVRSGRKRQRKVHSLSETLIKVHHRVVATEEIPLRHLCGGGPVGSEHVCVCECVCVYGICVCVCVCVYGIGVCVCVCMV